MHERWLEITMPSFSDDFKAKLRKDFLTYKLTSKELEKWTNWQLDTHLELSKEALKEQEELLENMVNEISFIKKVIKNLKNRIELLEKL